jgi:hypothetical protein
VPPKSGEAGDAGASSRGRARRSRSATSSGRSSLVGAPTEPASSL